MDRKLFFLALIITSFSVFELTDLLQNQGLLKKQNEELIVKIENNEKEKQELQNQLYLQHTRVRKAEEKLEYKDAKFNLSQTNLESKIKEEEAELEKMTRMLRMKEEEISDLRKKIPIEKTRPLQANWTVESIHDGIIFQPQQVNYEGIGSALQHIKYGIIYSMFLGYQYVVNSTTVMSKHGYDTGGLVGIGNTLLYNITNTSTSYMFPRNLTIEDLDAMCKYMNNITLSPDGERLIKELNVSHKFVVIKAPFKALENFNDCVQPFINKHLQRSFDSLGYRRLPLQVKKRVGIHIRYGDVKSTNFSALNFRAISLASINEVVSKMNQSKYEYYLFMQEHPVKIPLNFTFTFIDTGGDILDLFLLSQMDCIIQGSSSFGVLASMLSNEPDILLDTRRSSTHKYNQTYRHIFNIYDLRYENATQFCHY